MLALAPLPTRSCQWTRARGTPPQARPETLAQILSRHAGRRKRALVSGAVAADYDFDWIVIGSGFGGSVSALRLAEKGYRVAVLECGRRFEDEDFAESTWNFRRYYWMPKIGLRGIFRMTVFKDVFIVSGSGVGGGSLGYANTLYRARPAFFRDPQWKALGEWESALDPHYETAERMLGVTDVPTGGARRPASEGVRRRRSGSATPTSTPGSAPSSASRARRCRTRTSAARDPRDRAASAAGAAWSAAATTPRTRWSRTTSGSRRSSASRSSPNGR